MLSETCDIMNSLTSLIRTRDHSSLLWRSVKYEHVYLYEYETVPELEKGLHKYFAFYNHERPHQSLSYQTPAEVHFAGGCRPIAA